MLRTARARVLIVLFVLFAAVGFAAPAPASEAEAAEFGARLVALYAETFHGAITLDEASATSERAWIDNDWITVTVWQASTPKGRAVAFVAPDDQDGAMGVVNLDRDTVDVWQLAGPGANARMDANVVDFPVGQKSHLGVVDFVCTGVGAVVGAWVCKTFFLQNPYTCAVAGGEAGTVVCAGGEERTGRLQWHWKEDDPTGAKQSIVQYSTHYPTEGVYYQVLNLLCVRDADHPDDRRCFRPRQTGPSELTMDPHYVNYQSKITWSDYSRTTQYFSSWNWEVYPDVVYHASSHLSEGVPGRIDVETYQRFVGPTGTSEWLYLDMVRAHTIVYDV